MFCGSEGSKSRVAKAAGAESSSQRRDEKFAHRCRAKHISKSKCTKHLSFEALLGIVMLKHRCLWQAQGILHLAKSEQYMRVL